MDFIQTASWAIKAGVQYTKSRPEVHPIQLHQLYVEIQSIQRKVFKSLVRDL